MRVSFQSYFALNWVILLLAGLQSGISPFLTIYLKAELQWDPAQIGIALGIMNFANMLNQIPSGLLIDAYKIKRLLLVGSCFIFAISCYLITKFPYFLAIISAQILIGLATAIMPKAIVAITLGLVGTKEFPRRESINETLGHAGNIILALIVGVCSYFSGNIWIIYSYGIFSLLGILPIFLIRETDIDHDIARQLAPVGFDTGKKGIVPLKKVLLSRTNIIFLIAVFLFHFSSAAQLTLIGLIFVQVSTKACSIFMANSVIVSHIIMMFVSILLVYFIKNIPRKPLFLLAFLFIFIRAILFTFSHNPYFIIALQVLDGISGGIFGVIGIVMIAELAAHSGRFNFMLGLMVLCQGVAYAISNFASGYIVKSYNYNMGFYTLAFFAMIGFILFLSLMPETLKRNQ